MSKNVYLQAGNTRIKMRPADLLREASSKISTLDDAGLVYFLQHQPLVEEDNEYIDMELYQSRKSDMALKRDIIKLMLNEEYTSEDEFGIDNTSKSQVQLLEVWNTIDKNDLESVNDISHLLIKAADKLEEVGEVKVLDIIMHDRVDHNALTRPYIRIYYTEV